MTVPHAAPGLHGLRCAVPQRTHRWTGVRDGAPAVHATPREALHHARPGAHLDDVLVHVLTLTNGGPPTGSDIPVWAATNVAGMRILLAATAALLLAGCSQPGADQPTRLTPLQPVTPESPTASAAPTARPQVAGVQGQPLTGR